LSFYGLHKSAADGALAFAYEHSYLLRIASYTALVASKRNFLKNMLGLLASGENLTIVGDLQISLTTDLLLAKTIVHFIEMRPPFGTYNVVSEDSTSWLELFLLAATEIGFAEHLGRVSCGAISMMAGGALRPRHSSLNASKLRRNAPHLLSSWTELIADHCSHHRDDYRQIWNRQMCSPSPAV
jgi:dTDP-4-dehydrorhamnose reductase